VSPLHSRALDERLPAERIDGPGDVRSREKTMRLLGTIALTCMLMQMPVAAAGADPETGRVRVLACGPSGSLIVVLNPNAFSEQRRLLVSFTAGACSP
jgi:hypothetical protein